MCILCRVCMMFVLHVVLRVPIPIMCKLHAWEVGENIGSSAKNIHIGFVNYTCICPGYVSSKSVFITVQAAMTIA